MLFAVSFASVFSDLMDGFGYTLIIFFVTLALSVPLGLLIMFGAVSKFKPLKWLTKTFVWIIRGTPLMLQVIVVFYVPGLVFNAPFKSRLAAVLIAFVINYACYFSEIYRGGLESIPQGQYEAGYVLGMKKRQVFFHIVLMQIVKRILPPMGNEVTTLVKDTSLARVIMIVELIQAAQFQTARHGIIWPLFFTGVFYLIFIGGLTLLFGYLEKKLDYYKI
ncbi:MAG: amino acid ABC transporter permease [Christensenellales bacterium]